MTTKPERKKLTPQEIFTEAQKLLALINENFDEDTRFYMDEILWLAMQGSCGVFQTAANCRMMTSA
ncbi:MAG: hypothetical protein PHP85_14595 [Gallionella sp.]|nr:hypothetical protein [Gallionella sp.]